VRFDRRIYTMAKKEMQETSKSKKKVATLPAQQASSPESSSGIDEGKSRLSGSKGTIRERVAMKKTGLKAEKIKQNENGNFLNTIDLIEFLDQNQGVDFLVINLQDEESLSRLNFKNLIEKKTELVFLAQAFQRLLRIIPEKNQEAALSLMKEGIHSALQIAAMTRKDFMSRFADMFHDNGKLADVIYKNALEKRSVILIQYMNILQNREPHISAARFS
jgi:hypothetical protein